MKRIILFITLLSQCLYSYPQGSEAERLSFSKVIQVDGVNKESIFITIIDWIASNYRNIDNDSQVSDKDGGLIIKEAAFIYKKGGLTYKCYEGVVHYKMKFQIKDGRFRIELSSFVHDNQTINSNNALSCRLGIITTAEEYTRGGMQKGYNNKVWIDIKEKAEEQANKLFATFEQLDYNSFTSNDDDNW